MTNRMMGKNDQTDCDTYWVTWWMFTEPLLSEKKPRWGMNRFKPPPSIRLYVVYRKNLTFHLDILLLKWAELIQCLKLSVNKCLWPLLKGKWLFSCPSIKNRHCLWCRLLLLNVFSLLSFLSPSFVSSWCDRLKSDHLQKKWGSHFVSCAHLGRACGMGTESIWARNVAWRLKGSGQENVAWELKGSGQEMLHGNWKDQGKKCGMETERIRARNVAWELKVRGNKCGTGTEGSGQEMWHGNWKDPGKKCGMGTEGSGQEMWHGNWKDPGKKCGMGTEGSGQEMWHGNWRIRARNVAWELKFSEQEMWHGNWNVLVEKR